MSKITIEIDGKPTQFIGYEVKDRVVPIIDERERKYRGKNNDAYSDLILYGDSSLDALTLEIIGNVGNRGAPYAVKPTLAKGEFSIHYKNPETIFYCRKVGPRPLTLAERQMLGVTQPATGTAAAPSGKKSKPGPGRKKLYSAKALKRVADMMERGAGIADVARAMNLKPAEVRRMKDAHRKQQERRQ